MDAYITTINHIKPWPTTYRDGTPLPENALSDNLELAYIKNWQCVIQKNSFQIGEKIFYIQPDAQINPDGTSWADGIRRYLGGRGRVKIVKLRQQISNGIIVKLDEILSICPDAEDKDPDELCKILGIKHYEAPVPQCLDAFSNSLPPGIEKSDEENYQSIDKGMLRIGDRALVTKKIDGSSACIYYDPENDDLRVASRSLTLKLDKNNNYINACSPYFESVKALGKFLGQPICIRGEVYGNGINANKANLDAKKPLGFAVYGVRLPNADSEKIRYGCWGSDYHFTELNKILDCIERYGQGSNLKRFELVPVLDVVTITEELLKEYEEKPASDGEGVVFNFSCNDGEEGLPRSYKDKSADYYSKMK